MGLITKEVEIKWLNSNKNHYINKGYEFTKIKNNFVVSVSDLSKYSRATVEVLCDGCGELKNIEYNAYNSYQRDGLYYCKKCAIEKYTAKKLTANAVKINGSFKDWCIKNERYDLLDRWDYELNKCKPDEVAKMSKGFGNKGYYFKCPDGKHESELKNIINITKNNNNMAHCIACNSFAQWGINTFGESFLDKYWDYDKNNVNPWSILKKSNKKFFIKCQEKDYHGSYDVSLNNFYAGKRCPFCGRANEKVHPFDSLGQLLTKDFGEDFIEKIFSDKNIKTLHEVSSSSHQKMWWKCINEEHEDYQREVANSYKCEFRCPICNMSSGEILISNFLKDNNIEFVKNKEFDGLLGLGNGNLSYDFYIERYNLLIEFHGEQHKRFVKGFHRTEKDFLKQIEHDRRKEQYANNKNIELITIWYNQYNNVYDILSEWMEVNVWLDQRNNKNQKF